MRKERKRSTMQRWLARGRERHYRLSSDMWRSGRSDHMPLPIDVDAQNETMSFSMGCMKRDWMEIFNLQSVGGCGVWCVVSVDSMLVEC
jgi:hypothetical protein